MPLFDISVPVSELTPIYPGDPRTRITSHADILRGDSSNITALNFCAHTGTHLDAPAHYFSGAQTIEDISLETLIGVVQVIEVAGDVNAVTVEQIASQLLPETRRVIFKTRNSALWGQEDFCPDYTYLTTEAAVLLVNKKVNLVGIDYLSIDAFDAPDYPVHRRLLENGVLILEGLDLRGVEAGSYELLCLPLKIAGGAGDGAPARVVLRN